MKLTIYKTDGAYVPKGKADPSQRYDFIIRDKLNSGRIEFDLYDGKEHVTTKCKDVNALLLEFPNDREVTHEIEFRSTAINKTIQYDNEYAATSQRESIAKARELNRPFVLLDGRNCKLAVRTELVKGEY